MSLILAQILSKVTKFLAINNIPLVNKPSKTPIFQSLLGYAEKSIWRQGPQGHHASQYEAVNIVKKYGGH